MAAVFSNKNVTQNICDKYIMLFTFRASRINMINIKDATVLDEIVLKNNSV